MASKKAASTVSYRSDSVPVSTIEHTPYVLHQSRGDVYTSSSLVGVMDSTDSSMCSVRSVGSMKSSGSNSSSRPGGGPGSITTIESFSASCSELIVSVDADIALGRASHWKTPPAVCKSSKRTIVRYRTVFYPQ